MNRYEFQLAVDVLTTKHVGSIFLKDLQTREKFFTVEIEAESHEELLKKAWCLKERILLNVEVWKNEEHK